MYDWKQASTVLIWLRLGFLCAYFLSFILPVALFEVGVLGFQVFLVAPVFLVVDWMDGIFLSRAIGWLANMLLPFAWWFKGYAGLALAGLALCLASSPVFIDPLAETLLFGFYVWHGVFVVIFLENAVSLIRAYRRNRVRISGDVL